MRDLQPTLRRLPLSAAILLAAGCSAHWTPRSAAPEEALQWPFRPAEPKLTLARTLTGFSAQGGAGAAWRTFVYGREPEGGNDFVLPVAVAVAGDGRIAVADLGRSAVHLYLPAERRYLRLKGTRERPISSPVGLAFDEAARLYVSDSSGALFAYDAAGEPRFVLTTAGEETLQRPTGLAYSPERRRLYVVDTLAHRIHAFSTDGRLELSFGRRGEGEGELNFPTHLFRTSSGRLFVADSLNFRIAIFDEEGRPAGGFGHHGDGSGDLAMPKGVAVDRDGVVYVADSVFDNVQLFDERGAFLLTLGRRGTGFGEFWLPAGLFVGAGEELYVCDTYNHRVQVFRITPSYVPPAN